MISEIRNITKLNSILAIGYRYLGTYTFFIIPALSRMDFIADVVPDENNEKSNLPHNTYSG